jgi:hypothetical protein
MKDDKKKLMVLGTLVAVMAGVGAFSFLGGSKTPPPLPPEAAKPTDSSIVKVDSLGNVPGEAPEAALKNPLYAADLPQRDPFIAKSNLGGDFRVETPRPIPAASYSRPRPRSGGGGYTIPPYSPLSGQLPAAGGGQVTITAAGPDPSQFGYTVSGVITGGNKPAAVFTDSNGNQRLVPVGGSLDGDSKVVAVEKGNVTIEHRGKKQRLSLGGNPK